MLEVNYTSLHRTLLTQVGRTGQDLVAINMCQRFFVDFNGPRVSATALSALSKGLFRKSFDSTAHVPLGFRSVKTGHFLNALICAAALPWVGFGFLLQSFNAELHDVESWKSRTPCCPSKQSCILHIYHIQALQKEPEIPSVCLLLDFAYERLPICTLAF